MGTCALYADGALKPSTHPLEESILRTLLNRFVVPLDSIYIFQCLFSLQRTLTQGLTEYKNYKLSLIHI